MLVILIYYFRTAKPALTSTISMGGNSTGALRGSRLLETPTGDSCASNNALTRRHANWPDAHLFQSMLTFADECNLIWTPLLLRSWRTGYRWSLLAWGLPRPTLLYLISRYSVSIIGILYLSGEHGSEMMYACLTLLLTDVLSLRPYSIKECDDELGMTTLNEGGVQC